MAEVASFLFDLSATDQLDALLDEIELDVGSLDILVNNAGIFEPALAVELGLDSYRRVLASNLDAPIFLAKRAAKTMPARGYGRIVNIRSIHGEFGEETALSHDVGKAGLNQATRTFAIELGRYGVLVTPSRRGSSRRGWPS